MNVPYAGTVYDDKEAHNLFLTIKGNHYAHGPFCDDFERRLAEYVGTRYAILVNSGSSALLLAFAALMDPSLENGLKAGDEVITTACCFPTTVAPIVQYGCVPVFVDVTFPTLNVDVRQLEQALTEKTKAVVLAHTLGNPFDVYAVQDFCNEHGLWLLEDNCDALGSTYDGRRTGTFGDLSTLSFYPAHHIATGEGGAVLTNLPFMAKALRSLRDWGRDCICPPGRDGVCGNRYREGYDHKYLYSRLGYNLKATEFVGALGCAQMDKLPEFVEARKENWQYLNMWVEGEKQVATENSDPSWFAFALTTPDRANAVTALTEMGIATRPLFAGNITRQPCMRAHDYVTLPLPNTDRVMDETFFVGVSPAMTNDQREYLVECLNGIA